MGKIRKLQYGLAMKNLEFIFNKTYYEKYGIMAKPGKSEKVKLCLNDIRQRYPYAIILGIALCNKSGNF